MLKDIKNYFSELNKEIISYNKKIEINIKALLISISVIALITCLCFNLILFPYIIRGMLGGVIGLILGMVFTFIVFRVDEKYNNLINLIMSLFIISFAVIGVIMVYNVFNGL